MWYGLRVSHVAGADFVSAVTEALQSTSRHLILAVGGIYLAWHFVAIGLWPGSWSPWLVTPVVVVTFAAAYWLLPRHHLSAQVCWQAGLAAATAVAVYAYREPSIAFFYALLPMMAVVTLGWPAGVISEGLVIGLVYWLAHAPGLPALPPAHGLAIVAAGGLSGVLGWAAVRTLVTVLRWYVHSYAQAHENIEETRRHRAQLARTVKDLDLAYYRLHRANIALVAAQKAAEEAERFKAEFVTNVSHELRTPLNLIVGFSEMIMTSPESYGGVEVPGVYRGDMNAIYTSAQHLLAVVDDVLDLARIEVGKIPLAREEINLPGLVTDTVEMVREYAAAKGLDLQVKMSAELPAMWMDRLRIRQVLLNLLVNAARFTERGYIRVEVARAEREVVVRVTDTGRGIPEPDLPRVFQEFHTSGDDRTAAQWHGGTGLGLPISKKLVELHGGRMGVESVPGRGTAVWFTLPCELAMAPAQPQPGRPDRPQSIERVGDSERLVVVVHDDAQIGPLLQRYMDGYRVLSARTMKDGVGLAENSKALAIVADVAGSTPGADGAIPIVYCPLPDRLRAAAALGAADLLVKPVARRVLLAAIDRLGRPVRRVVIADDDPEVVRLFRRMLRTRVAVQDCLEAHNGAEALSLIQAHKPDLVLLDLIMPEVDGYGVLAALRGDPELAGIPVIVVSAKAYDSLSGQLPGAIQISRAAGFRLGEVVRLLEASLTVLAPGWYQAAPTPPGPAAAPAGSPASAGRPPPPAAAPAAARSGPSR